MRAFTVVLLLVIAPMAGCAGTDAPPATTDPAPEWSFTDTEGNVHSNETAEGSPTVIFYMATWCSSCKKLTTEMTEIHEQHASEGVDVLSVTVDPGEGPQDLEEWKEEYDQPWPHGVDRDAQLQRAFGVDSQSSVVVLDDEGYLVEQWGYGQATSEEVSAALETVEI